MNKIVKVMVNGIPGNMASNVAKYVLEDSRFELVPYTLTGLGVTASELLIGSRKIALIPPNQKEEAIASILKNEGMFISVDFTHPSAVNSNAEFYCNHGIPFVMGTTGGDREFLNETIEVSAIAAVIAPNMAKQIVGFQAMMEYAANVFPNLFAEYSLEILESHQKGKADTSGTAKAMVGYFIKLGIPFSEDKINMERDPDVQKDCLDVPEQYLSGHGWHTYTLVSPDATVKFEFIHNVNGRDIYAVGTLDAIIFLDKKVKDGAKGKVFTMIDVLKG